MPKTDNRCWSCGQNTMISFEEVGWGWLKCSSCGATGMTNPTVSEHIAPVETWKDERGHKHFHPSGVHF